MCVCVYLEHSAGLGVCVHDDSSALQRSDPQAELQFSLQSIRQSVLDVAVPGEAQRRVA